MLCAYLREGTRSLKDGSLLNIKAYLYINVGITQIYSKFPSLDPSFKDVSVSFHCDLKKKNQTGSTARSCPFSLWSVASLSRTMGPLACRSPPGDPEGYFPHVPLTEQGRQNLQCSASSCAISSCTDRAEKQPCWTLDMGRLILNLCMSSCRLVRDWLWLWEAVGFGSVPHGFLFPHGLLFPHGRGQPPAGSEAVAGQKRSPAGCGRGQVQGPSPVPEQQLLRPWPCFSRGNIVALRFVCLGQSGERTEF